MAYFSSFLQVARPSLSPSPPPSIFTTLPSSISISSPSSAFGLRNFPQLKTLQSLPSSSVRCMDSPEVYQVIDIEAEWVRDADSEPQEIPERDHAITPYIPVYVMLPLGVINVEGELNDQKWLAKQLKRLKDANVDGVMVDCWWGIVERYNPEEYNWDGYKILFQIVRELNLKLKVAMSFHECGGSCSEDVHIPLPHWVTEIGKSNPDIFFTNVEGRRYTECLSWGIDKERVLRGRTAIEAYFDYMRSFRTEFNVFFQEGIISEIQVGLGPCGELCYPSHPKFHGWEFTDIGEFQVVMSFHACGGNVGDDISIPLPNWVTEIGKSNPDIYFTDKQGWRNPECLSWGIDRKRVLRGRSAYEVYFDYMRSFQREFNIFFEKGDISEIEVGLGPSGELRYPSYPEIGGWDYPGIGEFQCYDKYLMKNLSKAAEASGYSLSEVVPKNTGTYNSMPYETGFFCDGGEYDRFYGRFFLGWYSQVLIDHADLILDLAKLTFGGTPIAAKISGIHWHYETASHAAELTAGFYNPINRDGYALIASMLKKHDATLNFTCVELRSCEQQENAFANPEGLVWQVLNAAWDVGLPVASENALLCFGRDGYNQILENAKPDNEPDGRRISAFTYLRLCPELMEESFEEFKRFVKRMHGEAVDDLKV